MRTLTHTRTHTVCGHPPDNVVADILDGDFHGGPGGEQGVQWCRVCGAYRRVFDKHGEHREGDWREPEGSRPFDRAHNAIRERFDRDIGAGPND